MANLQMPAVPILRPQDPRPSLARPVGGAKTLEPCKRGNPPPPLETFPLLLVDNHTTRAGGQPREETTQARGGYVLLLRDGGKEPAGCFVTRLSQIHDAVNRCQTTLAPHPQDFGPCRRGLSLGAAFGVLSTDLGEGDNRKEKNRRPLNPPN